MNNRIASIGITLVMLTLIVVMCDNRKMGSENESLSLQLQAKTQSMKAWQDQAGRHVAEIASLAAERKEMEKAFGERIDAYQRQISGLRRLESATEVSTESRGDVNIEITYPDDTIFRLSMVPPGRFSYRDEWATIDGRIIGDNLSISYMVKDSLSVVEFWKKRGFLKRPELTLNVTSHNPATRITGLQNLSILAPKEKWGIGVGIYYGIGSDGHGVFVGAGIQRTLISF